MAVGSCCVVVMSAISGSGSDIVWLLAKLVVVHGQVRSVEWVAGKT